MACLCFALCDDPIMCPVCHLREDQDVIPPEGLGRFPFAPVLFVDAFEGDIMAIPGGGGVFPNGGLHGADVEPVDWFVCVTPP